MGNKSVWPAIWRGRTPTQYRRPNAEDWQQLLAELRADRTNIQIEDPYIETYLNPGKPISRSLNAAHYVDDPYVIGIAKTEHTLQVSGIIELVGLIPESLYFLGQGEITTIPPQTGYLVQIGQSISSTQLVLDIRQPIKL